MGSTGGGGGGAAAQAAQIPTSFGHELRACLRCRLVKTYDQVAFFFLTLSLSLYLTIILSTLNQPTNQPAQIRFFFSLPPPCLGFYSSNFELYKGFFLFFCSSGNRDARTAPFLRWMKIMSALWTAPLLILLGKSFTLSPHNFFHSS